MKTINDVLDVNSALSSVGGDVGFLGEIAGLVEAALPRLLHDIQEALTLGDLQVAERRAHLAKRAAQYVSAQRASGAAQTLEDLARQGEFSAAQRAACELGSEVARLQPALAALASSIPDTLRAGVPGALC